MSEREVPKETPPNKLKLTFPMGTSLYLGSDPVSECVEFQEDIEVYVLPLIDQNIQSGSLTVGLMHNKQFLPEKLYRPIIAGKEEDLKRALYAFEKLVANPNVALSIRKKLEIAGGIEFAVKDSLVTGPENIIPY